MPSAELVITAFLGIALVASIVSRRTRTPYTIVLVLTGLLLAASSISSYIGVNLIYDKLVGGGLFVGLVLPALLFESMMNIPADEFRTILRPSILLATAGTAIATVVVGVLLWQVAALPVYSAFLFAALIAPTDVATVLEVFGRVKVPRTLSTLMETEAAFNDATAIAIFTLILTSFSTLGESYIGAIVSFTLVFGGGAAVGFSVAYGARLLSRVAEDTLSQIVLTIAAVYGSYALASGLGVSGLIAVAVTGLYFGNTVINARIPQKASAEVKSFWVVLIFIANTVAFLYIGLSTNIGDISAGLLPIMLAFAAVLASRLASVYPILGLKISTGLRVPRGWITIALLGGMRGALSIVLVASLPPTVPARNLIATMALGVVFLSIILQGPLLDWYTERSLGKSGSA